MDMPIESVKAWGKLQAEQDATTREQLIAVIENAYAWESDNFVKVEALLGLLKSRVDAENGGNAEVEGLIDALRLMYQEGGEIQAAHGRAVELFLRREVRD